MTAGKVGCVCNDVCLFVRYEVLPIAYQVDIRSSLVRTAKFLEKIMISDNGICTLFERHARIGRNKIFSTYIKVHSVSDLRCAIDELLFDWSQLVSYN